MISPVDAASPTGGLACASRQSWPGEELAPDDQSALLQSLPAPRPSEPELPFRSALGMLQAHLAQLCAQAASVLVADYEGRPDDEVHQVMSRAEGLVVSALEALDVVDVLYVDLPESAAQSPDETSADWDDRPSTPPIAVDSIEDVLLLARMGLHSRLRLLRGAGVLASSLQCLSLTGSALRTIQKSLSAIDRSLSRSEHVEPSVRFHEHVVERSLEVRARYVELSRFVLRGGAPQERDVRDRLLSASAAISRTLGLPIAMHLRTEDRALLMTSRARVRDWLLRRDQAPDHLGAGLRLFQDIAAMISMFLDVNRREELLQHDARLVRDALRDVPHGALLWDPQTRRSVLRQLAAMRGRSPALDALLDLQPDSVAARDLRPILEDLDESLAAVAVLDPEG